MLSVRDDFMTIELWTIWCFTFFNKCSGSDRLEISGKIHSPHVFDSVFGTVSSIDCSDEIISITFSSFPINQIFSSSVSLIAHNFSSFSICCDEIIDSVYWLNSFSILFYFLSSNENKRKNLEFFMIFFQIFLIFPSCVMYSKQKINLQRFYEVFFDGIFSFHVFDDRVAFSNEFSHILVIKKT